MKRTLAPRRAGLVAVGAGLGLAAGLGTLNRALLLDDLPPTLPGAMHDWTWRGWRVRYTTLGDGPPLVLIHSLHAAASSFEMDGIFEPLARHHTVYALDLLGFGKSQRPDTTYTGTLYAALIRSFLVDVVGQPAVLVASSLGTAYALAVAAQRPDLVRALVLISPTGQTEAGIVRRASGALLRLPLLGTAAFNALVSRPSIRRYLQRVYADQTLVDDALVDQHWTVSHQPNARYAPAAFIAGQLDLPGERAGGRVRAPILAIRGDQPGFGPETTDAAIAQTGGPVESHRVAGAGQLPHQEAPDRVVELVETWLGQIGVDT